MKRFSSALFSILVFVSLVFLSCNVAGSEKSASVRLQLPNFNTTDSVMGTVTFVDSMNGESYSFPVENMKVVAVVPGGHYYNVSIELKVGTEKYSGGAREVYVDGDVTHLRISISKVNEGNDGPETPETPENPGNPEVTNRIKILTQPQPLFVNYDAGSEPEAELAVEVEAELAEDEQLIFYWTDYSGMTGGDLDFASTLEKIAMSVLVDGEDSEYVGERNGAGYKHSHRVTKMSDSPYSMAVCAVAIVSTKAGLQTGETRVKEMAVTDTFTVFFQANQTSTPEVEGTVVGGSGNITEANLSNAIQNATAQTADQGKQSIVLSGDSFIQYNNTVSIPEITLQTNKVPVVIGLADKDANGTTINTNMTMLSTGQNSLVLKGSDAAPLTIDTKMGVGETSLVETAVEREVVVLEVTGSCVVGPNVVIRNNKSMENTFTSCGAVVVKDSAVLTINGLSMENNENHVQYNGTRYESGDINLCNGKVILAGKYKGSIFLYQGNNSSSKNAQEISVTGNFDASSEIKIIADCAMEDGFKLITFCDGVTSLTETQISCFTIVDWNGDTYSLNRDGSVNKN